LPGHHVLHDADYERDDRASDASAHGLPEKRSNVGATGRRERGDGSLKDLPASDTAKGAGNGIAELAEVVVLERGTGGIAADQAGDELYDEIDESFRHDLSPNRLERSSLGRRTQAGELAPISIPIGSHPTLDETGHTLQHIGFAKTGQEE
jgi:hypothetical protein